MNYSKVLLKLQIILILYEFGAIFSAEDSLNLCDNPVISAADRMHNGTVRLYRGGFYWDLMGMPDRVGILTKAQKITVPFLGPVSPKAAIMSCLECNRKGYLYKFENGNYWAWMANGYPFKTTSKGTPFKYNKEGFDALFHNGKKDDPHMIGLKGRKVFYYTTKGYDIALSPKYGGKGYVGGKNGENFPDGITAAFSWMPLTPEDGYYVFLFKGDKYCRRKEKPTSGQDCDEWRNNKELFGCPK